MVALVIVPVVLVYLAWRKFVAPWLRPPAERHYVGPVNAIETRAVVHGAVPIHGRGDRGSQDLLIVGELAALPF